MRWAAPACAWLILLAIPAALLYRRAVLRRQEQLLHLGGGTILRRKDALLAAASPVAVGILIVAALCRPQWGQVGLSQQDRSLDILVALDVSRSMLADDLHPSRLAAAKDAIARLLPHLQGERIGLIAFAGSAFLVCPATNDYDTFAAVLAESGPASIPLGGSALGKALEEAAHAFADRDRGGKILIVVSDGEDLGGDTEAAAAALRRAGVRIFAVAAGTSAGALIPLPGGEFVKDRAGAIVRSRLQSGTLQSIAAGKRPYDLAAEPKALETLYAAEISALEATEAASTRTQLGERFQIPLALALALLLLEPALARKS
jgi:Ca-activated chloride channel family protein